MYPNPCPGNTSYRAVANDVEDVTPQHFVAQASAHYDFNVTGRKLESRPFDTNPIFKGISSDAPGSMYDRTRGRGSAKATYQALYASAARKQGIKLDTGVGTVARYESAVKHPAAASQTRPGDSQWYPRRVNLLVILSLLII